MDKKEYDRNLALLRENLDEKIFHRSWERGIAMPLD
jgi:hypothetical protein